MVMNFLSNHFLFPSTTFCQYQIFDEVLIPSNHLYYFSCGELLVLCIHFLSVTSLDEVLIPGNHLYLLVPSDEFPDQTLFVFVNDFC